MYPARKRRGEGGRLYTNMPRLGGRAAHLAQVAMGRIYVSGRIARQPPGSVARLASEVLSRLRRCCKGLVCSTGNADADGPGKSNLSPVATEAEWCSRRIRRQVLEGLSGCLCREQRLSQSEAKLDRQLPRVR